MTRGEFLTRVTIWLALAGYAFGASGQLLAQGRLRWQMSARWAWTLGCLGLLVHVACAFHFYHGWSQTQAYRETARQTVEVTGLHWGGGLWINYIVLAAWMADVIWWWRSGDAAYQRRSRALTAAWHSLLVFIVFNATVVFKTGTLRWIGLALCLWLGLCWWLGASARTPARARKGIAR